MLVDGESIEKYTIRHRLRVNVEATLAQCELAHRATYMGHQTWAGKSARASDRDVGAQHGIEHIKPHVGKALRIVAHAGLNAVWMGSWAQGFV